MQNNTLLSKLGFQDPDKKNSKHDAAIHFVRQPEVLQQINDEFFSIDKKVIDAYSIPGDKAQITVTVIKPTYETEHPITKGKGQYKQTIGFIDGILRAIRNYTITSGYQTIIFEVTSDDLDALKNKRLERFPDAFCLPDAVPVCWDVVETQIGQKWREQGQINELLYSPREGKTVSDTDAAFAPDNSYYSQSVKKPTTDKNPIFVKGYSKIENYVYVYDDDRYERTCTWLFETKFHKTSAADIIRQVKLYREYMSENCWFTLTFFDLSDTEQSELSNAGIRWIRMGTKFDRWWNDQQQHTHKRARLEL
jgi:hypothetical protein